jgi:hypothetical protein
MYSLGEIEAQCKKAAKGIGLSWGVAEEAGLIARHLSEFNLPGPDVIYTNLKFIEENEGEGLGIDLKVLNQSNKSLNGFLLGISLIDNLMEFIQKKINVPNQVIGPLAVVGALLRLQNEKYFFSVDWEGCQIIVKDNGLNIYGSNLNPQCVKDLVITIAPSSAKPTFKQISKERSKIYNWESLTHMAHKTYVPESPQSRLLGAGAGGNENE